MTQRKNTLFEKDFQFKGDEACHPLCAAESCTNKGIYRAPKSRNTPRDYLFFCKDHIGPYNAKWNYYAGMTAEQVEKENDIDLTWRRPRHFFGTNQTKTEDFYKTNPYDLFNKSKGIVPDTHLIPAPVRSALKAMDLEYPYEIDALKKRYRLLAKQYHPDTAQGSENPDHFHKLLKHYQVLLSFLKKHPQF